MKDGVHYIRRATGCSMFTSRDGKKIGTWCQWDKNGKVVSIGNYDTNEAISRSQETNAAEGELTRITMRYGMDKGFESIDIVCQTNKAPKLFIGKHEESGWWTNRIMTDHHGKITAYTGDIPTTLSSPNSNNKHIIINFIRDNFSDITIRALATLPEYLDTIFPGELRGQIEKYDFLYECAKKADCDNTVCLVSVPSYPSNVKKAVNKKRNDKTGIYDIRSNGRLKSRITYMNGEKHGRYESYNEDGSICTIGEYEHDNKIGRWETNEIHQFNSKISIFHHESEYTNGVWNGPYTAIQMSYDLDTGNVTYMRESGIYDMGSRIGHWDNVFHTFNLGASFPTDEPKLEQLIKILPKSTDENIISEPNPSSPNQYNKEGLRLGKLLKRIKLFSKKM